MSIRHPCNLATIFFRAGNTFVRRGPDQTQRHASTSYDEDGVTVLASPPSGPLAASGLRNGEARIHLLRTGQEAGTLPYRRFWSSPSASSWISSLAWSPDGRLLASGNCSGLIHVEEFFTGEAQQKLNAHGDCPGGLSGVRAFARKVRAAFHLHTWQFRTLGKAWQCGVSRAEKIERRV